ncbi:M56 family metallopeptidase [Maribacter chungangensis]|uniref:M56 family metallopeptidase n=1 Tax=Maribacter chungangensis TaxID=1069117 RepID=A0ABW3AZP3_9FLAO
MGIYLLKFTACLAILYVFYKVCLENENMHTFKRVYLLASLAAALIIPIVVFTEYVEVTPVSNIPAEDYTTSQRTASPVGVHTVSEHTIIDVAPILWSVYFIGVLFFGVKFLKNLYQILGRIRNNPRQKWNRFIYVLLKDPLPPHTFLSYIFLNRQKFEANEIPEEVLVHEEAHAFQKHSYDILFVEFLQVIFWINPFIFLIKKAIKLNHEFLADEAVLHKNISTVAYQNTLLSFLSKDSENQHPSPLVNPINYSSYSSIKKRFNIMKTRTSKPAILLRSLLLLPLGTLLLFGFSTTKKITKTSTENPPQINRSFQNSSTTITDLNFLITANGTLTLNEKVISVENIQLSINELNPNLTKEQNTKYVNASILTETDNQQELVSRITNELLKSNIYSLSISNINTLKALNIYKKSNSSRYHGKTLEEAKLIYQEQETNPTKIDTISLPSGWKISMNAVPLKEMKSSFNSTLKEAILTTNTFQDKTTIKELILNIDENGQLFLQNDKIPVEDLQQSLSKINPHLTKQERQQMVRAVVFAPLGTPQKVIDRIDAAFMEYGVATINIVGPEMEIKITGPLATPEQVAEYNKLAKHYNRMPRNKMKIYKKDVARLEYLFSKMSDEQKSNAEPFPDFPEPPPAPKAPNGLSEREEAAHTIQKIIEEQDPYDVVNTGIRINTKGKKVVFPENTHVYIRNSRSSPKTPSGLVDHLASDDLKNAQFYFEGEKISSKKGLELIKNKKDIKIETLPYKNKQPEVRIYKSESKGTIPPPPSAPKVVKRKLSDSPPPPLPPKPISPLDHVIAMAKKDAQFLYEGKEISSDKAIKLLKNNKDLNIDSRASKGKRPVVKISASPIEIE